MDDLRISVLTNDMPRSVCSWRLETYHGALARVRRSLDWKRWRICVSRASHSPTAEFHMSTQVRGHICRGEFYCRGRVGSGDLGAMTLPTVCDKINGVGGSGSDSCDSWSEKVANSCEHGTDIRVSGSINIRNRLTNYLFHKHTANGIYSL